KDDDRARIADMGEIINCRSADIHAYVARIDRNKVLLRARQRVIKPKSSMWCRHDLSLAGWPGRFAYLWDESENGRASEALADNANAGNGERRFHRLLYRFPPGSRQDHR